MKYGNIPYVSKEVCRIIYGTASSPFMDGQDQDDLLDAVVGMGVNTFDTAREYGDAEYVLGRWMQKRGNREDLVLISKCAHPEDDGTKRLNEHDIREDFEISARALQTDYIDIYLLHRDDPDVDPGEMVELFNAMHAEGKIGAFGGSNWKPERIALANEYAARHNLIPFTVSSPNFGLAEQICDLWGGGCETISGPANNKARDFYRDIGMPVIAYSCLGRGLFSGRIKSDQMDQAARFMDDAAVRGYVCEDNFERLRRCEQLAAEKGCTVSQIAMSWIFCQDLDVYAVVSTSSSERMKENIDAPDIELTRQQQRWLDLQES